MCSRLANTKSLAISSAGEDLEPWVHLGTAVGNGDQWATSRKNLSYGTFDHVHTLQPRIPLLYMCTRTLAEEHPQ